MENTTGQHRGEQSLAGYLAILRRRYLILVACLVAGLIGGFLQVQRTPKMYEATSTYFVTLPASSGVNADVQQNAVTVAQSFLQSFVTLATKRSTADAIATRLGVDVSSVDGHLSSSVETGTFYIDVTAKNADPTQAKALADAAAQTITTLIPQIQGTSQNPANASVTDLAAVPNSPYQPTPKTTIGLGGLLGLVAGLLVIAAVEALDRTVRSSEVAGALAQAPVLGQVPRRKAKKEAPVYVDDGAREPYRSLRAAVNFLNPDSSLVTVMVTSPIPGDGKTTTAANLAATYAESGAEVLLIDADLRRHSLTRSFGLRRAPGVSSVISREELLAGVVVKDEGVFFLPSGPDAPNPSELLGSLSAVEMFDEAKARFDVVIIDAPPVLAVSDAVTLAPHVDAVVVVTRHGHTPRAALAEASRRLAAVGRPPAGIVYNALPHSEAAGYYGAYTYEEV